MSKYGHCAALHNFYNCFSEPALGAGALDGLFFSEEAPAGPDSSLPDSLKAIRLKKKNAPGIALLGKETSSCCWEIGLCAAATFGLLVASDLLSLDCWYHTILTILY